MKLNLFADDQDLIQYPAKYKKIKFLHVSPQKVIVFYRAQNKYIEVVF